MVQELINIQKSLTDNLSVKQKLLNIVENFPQLLVRVRPNLDEGYYTDFDLHISYINKIYTPPASGKFSVSWHYYLSNFNPNPVCPNLDELLFPAPDPQTHLTAPEINSYKLSEDLLSGLNTSLDNL